MPPKLKKRLAEALAKLGEDVARKNESDPRRDAVASYKAFMQMPQSEWLGLVASLARGGVLQPEEQKGFEHARRDRPHADAKFNETLMGFETIVREHQSERLPEYREAHAKDLKVYRERLLVMYHKAKMGGRR